MGYCMYLRDCSLHIKKENYGAALEAVKAAFSKEEDIQQFEQFEDAMDEFYYRPEYSEDGDICGLSFDGEKLRDDFEFWSAVAPYVEDGSYIEMDGEDFNLWRWAFKNGICKEIEPIIIWEDE